MKNDIAMPIDIAKQMQRGWLLENEAMTAVKVMENNDAAKKG